MPAPTPLFSALLNYRYSASDAVVAVADTSTIWEGFQVLRGEERTNYPLALSIDDLGEGFSLTAQVEASVEAMRVCQYMQRALESLVTALETAPSTAVRELEVLPSTERHQLLYGWNDTAAEYPADRCVHELFEVQAADVPMRLRLSSKALN